MNRFIFISLISLFLAVPVWAGYTIDTGTTYGPYEANPGGEFTLMPGGGLEVYLNNYDPLAKGESIAFSDGTTTTATFQTFCVEATGGEYILLNHQFIAALNTNAVAGGTGNPLGPGDPISVGTAYLYYQFAKGNLSGYNYTGGTSARLADAAELQQAIWYLEGEIPDPGSNSFMTLVNGLFADPFADNNLNQYPVMALNLTNSGELYQDQHTSIPTDLIRPSLCFRR